MDLSKEKYIVIYSLISDMTSYGDCDGDGDGDGDGIYCFVQCLRVFFPLKQKDLKQSKKSFIQYSLPPEGVPEGEA